MRGGLAKDLVLFLIGLVLGYFFAVYGGGKVLQSVVGSMPAINLGRPGVVLILIGLVLVAIIFMARGRK